jgi:uncharacterized protein (TIGR00159 family)
MVMHLLLLFFITFGINDAVDILLVAIILYLAYNLVKGTSAINIFIGLAFIYFAFIVIKAFDLKLLSSILGKFVNLGVIAVMIVFQQEIRKFLLYLGSNEFIRNKSWKNLLSFNMNLNDLSALQVDAGIIAEACFNMSATKTGALLVIARKSDLKFYIQTGDLLDSALTCRMLENIFYKNSPLHDGAVIVVDNRIVAARCILPVSENDNFPANYGMRHRAAVGITENTDAIAISVSEQSGAVSFTVNGEIKSNLSKEKLIFLLEKNTKQ